MENPSFNSEQIAGIVEVYKKIRVALNNNNVIDKDSKLFILYSELLDEFINLLETKSHFGISANYIKKYSDELTTIGNAVSVYTRCMITYNEIIEGKNLEYHRKQVEGVIKAIDEKIEIQKIENKATKVFEAIRNLLILLQQKMIDKN